MKPLPLLTRITKAAYRLLSQDFSEGKTVIMIAHRLSTVTNVDQIFVICDGRVAECGNSRELLAKDGIFSRMWKNYQTSVQWKVTKEVQ